MIEYSINVSPVKRMKNGIHCVLTLMKCALRAYVAKTLAFAKTPIFWKVFVAHKYYFFMLGF